MRITESQLRRVIKNIILEQAGGLPQPSVYLNGKTGSVADLPKNVKRVVSLFANVDVEKNFMQSFSVRQLRSGAYQVIRFGEKWGYQKSRGDTSSYGSVGGDYTMVNIDPDSVKDARLRWMLSADITPDGKTKITASAGPESSKEEVIPMNKVKEWAANLSNTGYGWQVDEYKPGQLGRGASGIRV